VPAGLEVEAKVALRGPPAAGALRRRLADLGATPEGRAVQEDTFFAHPARDLVAGDEALRLRTVRTGSATTFELTHKGPRQAGGLKARRETTVRLADDPTELLRDLGFAPSVRLRKAREGWRLGSVHVALDEVDGLGWFAEVEAVAGGAAAVQLALGELGLADEPLVQRSYVELALAAGAAAAERV